MKSRRRTRKFWKHFLTLFSIYIVIVPVVFILFDRNAVAKHFRKDPGEVVMQFAGIAVGIALIISLWFRNDPELRRW